MRRESASECAGFADSTIIARNRFGWSVRISSAITLQATSPPITGEPVTGVTTASRLVFFRAAASGTSGAGMYALPGSAKCPVSSQTSFSR